MDKKYIVISRYEHWTSNEGVKFTKWFVLDSTPRTREEAENLITEIKATFAHIDKITKLNHEFDIKLYGEYIKEQENQKKTIEELAQKQKEYYKSAEYKELLKKKRQAAKELKERQRKYAEEHPEKTS